MRVLFAGLLAILTTTLIAQENQFNPDIKYHPDSLKHWTKSVMNEVSKKHPGFYRYTSKEKFDNLIDSTILTINESFSELEYYRKLKPLFAQIGCLHTGISLSKEYQNYLDETPTLIPIEIFIDSDNNFFIAKNYDKSQNIHIGSKILTINGKTTSGILNKLLRTIPSDGFNQTEKILLLNHRFAFWYQSMIELTQSFTLEIESNGVSSTNTLAGVSKEVFPPLSSLESNYEKPLEFEIKNKVGILKVHSFAESRVKENGQHFKKFIKTTFKQIQNSGIENLVIDLRYNAGGSDGNAVNLASYFFDKSFRYWDKIEVTEDLAKEIKGLVRLVYRKPIKEGETFRWRKGKLTNEFDYYLTQKPANNNYKGATYILTNGLCMSSCSDFVAILSHNQKAVVVGQESGGGFQGNTSGIIPTAKIRTGLHITVPLQKYTNAVDLTKNYGHGTIPDFQVGQSFEDWIDKKDIEMEFVLELINNK